MTHPPAAQAAYDAYLGRLQPAIDALPVAPPAEDASRRRAWAIATAYPARGELDRIGHFRLVQRPVEGGRSRVELHQEIRLLFRTVATTEGHFICRGDAWRSLESWQVTVRQRFTTPAPKKADRRFDRAVQGRVEGNAFRVDGQPAVDCGAGPVIHELSLLEYPARLVGAGRVHVSRDFDAVVSGQTFSSLGRAKTPWGDLDVVLQTGPASLPVTYWLRPSGGVAIACHGTRLWIETASAGLSPEDGGG